MSKKLDTKTTNKKVNKTVTKRDLREVKFDINKIIVAIEKAMQQTDKGVDTNLATKIAKEVQEDSKDNFDVEAIQDMVEYKLMDSERKDVAKKYISYRDKRSIARGHKTHETFMSIVNIEDNETTRENANMNTETPSGMMMKFGSESSKQFAKDMLLSEDVKEAIKNNEIHPHDLDFYPTKSLTCLQHPLNKVLEEGFRAGHGSTRPSKRIETAATIACISMETVQNK